jgi:hypothetical protein
VKNLNSPWQSDIAILAAFKNLSNITYLISILDVPIQVKIQENPEGKNPIPHLPNLTPFQNLRQRLIPLLNANTES